MTNKPKLRLGFTDYFGGLDEFFTAVLSQEFEITRDDANPDYLIFCDETFGQNNLNYDINKVRKIFYTGENRRPWNYQAHHAISFDHLDGSQFYRLPLYIIDNWISVNKLNLRDLMEHKREYHPEKKSLFCGFVVGNPNCAARNNAFHLISQYKQVSSAGPVFNNIGHVIPRGLEAAQHKFDFLSKCKFNLCYENSSYPGYVTEKIQHAFVADTIPIYWGCPISRLDFNKDAYISRHNYSNDKEMLEHIIHLDNNEQDYIDMITKPIIAYDNLYINLNRFNKWFIDNVYRG